MRLRLLCAPVLVAAALLPAADAAAQAECQAPQVRGFLIAPDRAFRTGRPEVVGVHTSGATSVTIAWGNGTTTTGPVGEFDALVRHVFRRTGPRQIVATATGACGTSAPAGLTVDVRSPCVRDRTRSVYGADCDVQRGEVAVSQRGLSTGSSWLNFPCNDVIFPVGEVPPEPVARAAACAAPTTAVPGLLPVRSDSVLHLRFGVPARSVRLALGNTRRPLTRFKRAARSGRSGRSWRIRLATVRTSTRLWMKIRRPLGDDVFVAGLRPQ